MINQETTRKLHEMRLIPMIEALESQEHIENIRQMSFEDRLELLVDVAYNTRQNNKLERLIKDAGFSTTAPAISNIDYQPDRQLDQDVINKLATGAYIKAHHNVLLMGASGNGKTWLATALGIAACRQFYKVRYVRLPELMDDLLVAKNEVNGDFKKILVKYGRPVHSPNIIVCMTKIGLVMHLRKMKIKWHWLSKNT
ncbi:ATP-binding protein [Lapidilactobacillus bayanensis]|uniref:ATP-binding protein n=1 Tax=Lapidilactobacillus bayanensis TaxID=2485998 RepID=UPI001CDBF2A2